MAFWVSPEENAQVETGIKLARLAKQGYIIWRHVMAQGRLRVCRTLRDPLVAVLDELIANVFEGESAMTENLLNTEAYILVEAQKIGKSLLVA